MRSWRGLCHVVWRKCPPVNPAGRSGAGSDAAKAPEAAIKCLRGKDLVILNGFSVENGEKMLPWEPSIGKVRTIVLLPRLTMPEPETLLLTGISDRERGTSSGFRGGSSAIRFVIAASGPNQRVEEEMGRKDAILKLRQVLLHRRDALRKALAGDLTSLRNCGIKRRRHARRGVDCAQDEISSQLAEVESRELAQIESALERMRNGTYGICEVTGKPIPLARLQALPYATMCIEAEAEAEKTVNAGGASADWGQRSTIPRARATCC